MDNFKYYIIQDGSIIDQKIKQLFSKTWDTQDFVANQQGERINFVGFIYDEDKILVSFPKHSFTNSELKTLSKDKKLITKYLKILFNCIKKTANNKSNKYTGIREEINNCYPFNEFLEVYQYYKTFGLFTNETEVKKFGYAGKISWKDTINKSPKIVQGNNLFFLPLVIKESREQYEFISKCMAHVIDSTLETFSFLFNWDKTNLDTQDIDFSNTCYVISKLKSIKRTLFKNIHQRLINNLISFFQFKNKSGIYKLKLHSFHLVWESMVSDLLKTKFYQIDENFNIVWSKKILNNNFQKRTIYPDIRGKLGYSIEPDYYLVLNNKRYIFDAKYYQDLSELDYKQIAYYFLLKHFEAKKDNTGKISNLYTYNALILPTELDDYSETHFQLNPEYNLDEERFIVKAFYLNMIKIMRYYTGIQRK